MKAPGSRPPSDRCPDPLTITRAVSQPPQHLEPALRTHIQNCHTCNRQWQSESEIAVVAKLLPYNLPSPTRRLDTRRELLNQVQAPPMPRRFPRSTTQPRAARAARGILTKVRGLRLGAWGAAAGLAVAVGLGIWALGTRGGELGSAGRDVVRPAAVIDARPGTRYSVVAGPPHEKVNLEIGSLRISVEPATRGETFQVITARGEVEVRGTVFEAVAAAAGLVAVRVERGQVVVRPERGVEVALSTGAEWTRAPEPRTPAPELDTPPRLQTPAPEPRTRLVAQAPAQTVRREELRPRAIDVEPSAEEQSPASSWGPDLRAAAEPDPGPRGPGQRERSHGTDSINRLAAQAFDDGLTLLRVGSLEDAARAFERVAALSPASPLIEDASYWRAVALARVGDKAAARQAQRAFLERFPLSPRAGEVSVMLGWLLLDSDPAMAAAQFRAGLGDRSPRVQQSARDGLAALKSAAP